MEIKITVERRRPSVTQGEAVVLINGTPAVTFGDTIELIKPGESITENSSAGGRAQNPTLPLFSVCLLTLTKISTAFAKRRRQSLLPKRNARRIMQR